jgi:hypothetical protein
MDKQKLPLQVLRDLERLKEKIKKTGLIFELHSSSEYLMLVQPIQYPDFYFKVDSIKQTQHNDLEIFISYYPANEFSIKVSFGVSGSIQQYFDKWIATISEYNSIDISAIFQSEDTTPPLEPQGC